MADPTPPSISLSVTDTPASASAYSPSIPSPRHVRASSLSPSLASSLARPSPSTPGRSAHARTMTSFDARSPPSSGRAGSALTSPAMSFLSPPPAAGVVSASAPGSAFTSPSAAAALSSPEDPRSVSFDLSEHQRASAIAASRRTPSPQPMRAVAASSSSSSRLGSPSHSRSKSAVTSPTGSDGRRLPLSPRGRPSSSMASTLHDRNASLGLFAPSAPLSSFFLASPAGIAAAARRKQQQEERAAAAAAAGAAATVSASPKPVPPASALSSGPFASRAATTSRSQPSSRRASRGSMPAMHASSAAPAAAAPTHSRSPSQRATWSGLASPSPTPTPPPRMASPMQPSHRASAAPSPSPHGRDTPSSSANLAPVQVYCRFRPCFEDELAAGDTRDLIAIAADSRSVQVAVDMFAEGRVTDSGASGPSAAARRDRGGNMTEFQFQHVFQPHTTQAQVYDRIVEHGSSTGGSILDQLFEGKNCSILAYGQTGTGKSWSMEGPSSAMLAAMSPASVAAASLSASLDGSEEPESESAYSLRGLIPRLVEAIFRRLQEQHQAAAAAQASHNADDASSIPVSPSTDPARPSSAPASFSSAGSSGDLDVSVQISFFELYRGKIRDLLAGGKSVYEVEDNTEPSSSSGASAAPIGSPLSSPTSAGSSSSAAAPGSSPPPATTARALQLQMKDKQVVVIGLSERSLRDSKSVLRALKEGQRHRTVARTNANAWSSRGHAIFDVCLRQTIRRRVVQEGQDVGDMPSHTIVSRLRLVDLAGSEQHVESGQESARLEEARSINRSLTFLGKVITSLSQREKHISYRDALLTRLLSQSLGGNCTTTLLITASPARASLKKTLNTLRFGAGATSILNAVSVNSRRRPGSVAMNYAIPALPLSALDEWEEAQCWTRLQTVQKRDGALKCVPVEWVRTLLVSDQQKRKERRSSGAGLTPGSPIASKENSEAVHALNTEVETLRKSLSAASSHSKLAEAARASALASAALASARLRDLEVNSRALLGLLNKIGVVRAAQRVQSAHDASAPGSNLLSSGAPSIDSVQTLIDDLLASVPSSEKDAASTKFSSLKAVRKLIQFFPVECCVDGSSAAATGARAIRSPLASPTRSRSSSSTRASPGAAPRSASSTRSAAAAAKADDAVTAEKMKQLEARNAALASELAAAKRAVRSKTPVSALARDKSPAASKFAVLPSAEQAALQSELDASYREITRVNAENTALQSKIKALQQQQKKQLKPSTAAAAGAAAAPVIVATKLPELAAIEELHLSAEQKEQLNAQVEARVAQETAQLREQLVEAQEQARAAAVAASTASSSASPAAASPQPQQVNRQLFPSATAAATAPTDAAATAAEIDSRVESLLAERTQQLHHDFAQEQAAWMAAKEREWAQLQETFQADVQAQQMQLQQHAQELQQQAETVLQQKEQLQRQRSSIDLDRTLNAAMQSPNATASRSPSSASFSRSATGLAAPGEDTVELAAALTDQVAAEKSAFIVDLRARIAEEQRLWAGALTSEHGALLRREIGEEAAAFDARFRHLEFSLSARVDSVAQKASRQLHEHHLALQNRERQIRQKVEQEFETRKLEWQQSAVQSYQQQQREEEDQRSKDPAAQRDPDASPLSPTRGGSVDPTLPLRAMEQQTSVRLALLELEKVDLEARERQVHEWKMAVEAQEAKQRAYASQQRENGVEEQMMDHSDLVRKVQAEAAALLESERAAHAAALEAQRQSSASELDSLLSQRLAVELERLHERFSLEKLDWMDRSKRNLDATIAEQVAQERSKIEARLSQSVQERVVVELERSKAALKIEQAAKWDSALREQTSIQTAQHQSQIDALSLQLASMHDRWEERERSFSRLMADQGSKAKEEVRRLHVSYQHREASARAQADAEISALRSTVDTAQIRADDSKALALQAEYLSREKQFQTNYQSFIQQQMVEPLTKENQALRDQLQMITMIQQQTQHEQRFSPAAQPPIQQQQQQQWETATKQNSHTRKRLDYIDQDEEEEKQQPPPTPSPRIFVSSSPTSSSAAAPNAAANRAATTPSKHEVERREIKAQIAQLEDQLLQVKSPPPASTAAKKRSPRAAKTESSGLGSPSRQTLRVDSSPSAIVAHMDSADRSDYPFGSAVAKSMQLVDRLHVHQAAEQARLHLEAADAELNSSSVVSAAAPVGSDAGSSSPAASSSSFRPPAAPSFIPAALDISLLEGDLYTQHRSYLAGELEGAREVSELEQRNARESQKMEQELLKASSMMREALAPAPVASAAVPTQSDAAKQQDEQLAQMQAELRQTQEAIQQLVAAAAAAKAPQLVEAEPSAAVAAPISSSPSAVTTAVPDLPAEVRAMISGLKNELGETNKLLQSERASRLASAAAAASSMQRQAKDEEEERKLDATLNAHAMIHSIPTPPLSPIASGVSPWSAAAGPASSAATSSSTSTSAAHAMYRAPTTQPLPFRSSAGGSDFAATIARDAPFRSTELATPAIAPAPASSPSLLDDSFTARSEELRAAERRTEEARRRVQNAVHSARTSHGDGSMRAPLLHVVPPPPAAIHSFSSSRLTIPAASAPSAVSARSHLQHLQLPFGSAPASSPRWSSASDAWRGIRR